MAMEDPRVLVVGAGAAGLSAATALNDAGRDVLCLDARDRVGGRLLSTTGDEPGAEHAPLDLGATWFWDGQHRAQALVSRFNVTTFAQHTAGNAVFQDATGVHVVPGNPIDVPAQRYAAGADTLTAHLATTLPAGALRLGSPVTAIRRVPEGLEVTTPTTCYRVGHVVLAVPPALAIRHINFHDALSDEITRLAAATPVWMGTVVKIVAVYAHAFWRQLGLAGAAISRVGPLQEIHDMSGPGGTVAALFGFTSATAIQPGFRRAVTNQLAELFGAAGRSPQVLYVQDWSREEWTSPPEAQHINNYRLLGNAHFQRPELDGRLHWASTETASRHAGHLEGALVAGQRAANAVLSAPSSTAISALRR